MTATGPAAAGDPSRRPLITRHPRVTIAIALAIAAIGTTGLVLNMFAPAHFDSRPGEVLPVMRDGPAWQAVERGHRGLRGRPPLRV